MTRPDGGHGPTPPRQDPQLTVTTLRSNDLHDSYEWDDFGTPTCRHDPPPTSGSPRIPVTVVNWDDWSDSHGPAVDGDTWLSNDQLDSLV